VGLAHRDVLLLFTTRLTSGRLWCCHCLILFSTTKPVVE
jgi:hypothetical protein